MAEQNIFTTEDENNNSSSQEHKTTTNPRKLAKQLRNDPKMLQFINDYRKGLMTNDVPENLSPKEKLQRRLNNIKKSRMSQVGQTHVKENKKEDIQRKIDSVKAKIEKSKLEDSSNQPEINLNTNNNNIRKTFVTKMKKLQKKYGTIDNERYLQLIKDMNTKPDPHTKNLIDLYNYQNPKKEEQVLEFSDDED